MNNMLQSALEYREEYNIIFNQLTCQFISYGINNNDVLSFNAFITLDTSFSFTRGVNSV